VITRQNTLVLGELALFVFEIFKNLTKYKKYFRLWQI